jgi:hypothetical protein
LCGQSKFYGKIVPVGECWMRFVILSDLPIGGAEQEDCEQTAEPSGTDCLEETACRVNAPHEPTTASDN